MKKRKASSSESLTSFLFSLFMAVSFAAGYITSEAVKEPPQAPPALSIQENTIRTCFSPQGGCEERIVNELRQAKEEILVHAYAFTSIPLADALIEAKSRGVIVKVLCDKSQMNGRKSQVKRLLQAGIDVRLDKVPGIAHNKIMILDEATTISGSYNWSEGANTRNAENLLFIKDKQLAQIYKNNWLKRHGSSQAIETQFLS